MKTIINLLITAAVAYALTMILSGVHIEGFGTAIVFALVLGLLNFFVRPILGIIGLPLTIITLGLFSLVLNAIIILLADYFLDDMTVDGFWWAFIFSIALSLVTSVVSGLINSDDK